MNAPARFITIRSAAVATWLALNGIEPVGTTPAPKPGRNYWFYPTSPRIKTLLKDWSETTVHFIYPSTTPPIQEPFHAPADRSAVK